MDSRFRGNDIGAHELIPIGIINHSRQNTDCADSNEKTNDFPRSDVTDDPKFPIVHFV